jgi:hypothetical protein
MSELLGPRALKPGRERGPDGPLNYRRQGWTLGAMCRQGLLTTASAECSQPARQQWVS